MTTYNLSFTTESDDDPSDLLGELQEAIEGQFPDSEESACVQESADMPGPAVLASVSAEIRMGVTYAKQRCLNLSAKLEAYAKAAAVKTLAERSTGAQHNALLASETAQELRAELVKLDTLKGLLLTVEG